MTARAPARRARLGVAAGMAVGLGVTVGVFVWPGLAVGPTGVESRLAQWLRCDAVISIWLLIAVARLAHHRFVSTGDIDGALGEDSHRARVLQALVQNTLEQTVLAVVAYGAWLLIADPMLPTATVWASVACFCVGRLLFFAGYGRGAPARALGFVLTFYPTVGLILVRLAWLIRTATAPAQ